jgi:SNF2 family DNA or RNA helicase
MSSYILPDRKAFADSITRIFKNYRAKDVGPADSEDKDVDLCLQRTGPGRELLPYQKLVRDYLLAETPYRGLLVYHGLGSGKTCSAIAVAESLMSTHKIFVMLPASLQANFRGELRKCGDPFYQEEQHWEVRPIRQAQDIEQAKGLGISQAFIDSHMKYFITVPNRPPNFKDQPADIRKGISEQVADIIDQRFTFINYDGISKNNIDTIFPPDQPSIFDNSVVIVDEAHNFIRSVVNESVNKQRIYDTMYHAKNAKIVLLSGTPIVNNPTEICYLMNLIRGPIERVSIPTTEVVSWDEGLMTAFFRNKR